VRIAIVGTRGIPANYGGFETFAEELSTRLIRRGHEVTVYCRARHPAPAYRGVRLQYLPAVRHKYLDTVSHTFVSTLHLALRRADVALYCNGATALFTGMARLAGIPAALNVDGIERKRRKWNLLGKAWYLMSERLSTWLPNEVISDARAIQQYYLNRYGKKSTFIAYGAETARAATTAMLQKLRLEPRRYFLYVTRMEPENHPLEVREAFERVATDMRLALIGDAPYSDSYIRRVRQTSDPRIVIPGGVYGEGYRELQSHCFAYVHATEVGGTHPALIEAMGRGALVLYRDTPENSEVAGGAGIPFRGDLADRMRLALSMPEAERDELCRRAVARVRERYCWEAVTTEYERLFQRMVKS
jgi:glycosyltransferase involved in cell wall biosynthesis